MATLHDTPERDNGKPAALRIRWTKNPGFRCGKPAVLLAAELVPYARKGAPLPEPIPLFRQSGHTNADRLAWRHTYRVLDGLNLRPAQRERIEAAVATRVPRWTREQVEAGDREALGRMRGFARGAVGALEGE